MLSLKTTNNVISVSSISVSKSLSPEITVGKTDCSVLLGYWILVLNWVLWQHYLFIYLFHKQKHSCHHFDLFDDLSQWTSRNVAAPTQNKPQLFSCCFHGPRLRRKLVPADVPAVWRKARSLQKYAFENFWEHLLGCLYEAGGIFLQLQCGWFGMWMFLIRAKRLEILFF